MASTKKSLKPTKTSIIAGFMTHALEHNEFPNNVYQFCKQAGIEEVDFYQFFGSLEAVQKQIWVSFFDNVIEVLHKNDAYHKYSNKEKMLSFFYSMFEVLTLNRSYVLFALNKHQGTFENLRSLQSLRNNIKKFAGQLIEEGNEGKQLKITQHNVILFSEGAWIQFLFLLRFWMKDESVGFEKTDVAIEKSVRTIFDVFDHTPLDSLLDLGKFLFKETIA